LNSDIRNKQKAFGSEQMEMRINTKYNPKAEEPGWWVVGIATGYRLDNREFGVQVPVGSGIFSTVPR
jgi:hypothetical protein